MERIGQETQLYAGRRICDGQEVEVCLSYARSPQEAFGRLARRMFLARLVEKDSGDISTREFTPEQIDAVLWKDERFVVFPVVFDPIGIATIVYERWG